MISCLTKSNWKISSGSGSGLSLLKDDVPRFESIEQINGTLCQETYGSIHLFSSIGMILSTLGINPYNFVFGLILKDNTNQILFILIPLILYMYNRFGTFNAHPIIILQKKVSSSLPSNKDFFVFHCVLAHVLCEAPPVKGTSYHFVWLPNMVKSKG